MATIAILTFQATWNNAEVSTLYINSESLKTFAFYLTTLTSTTTGANTVAGQGMASHRHADYVFAQLAHLYFAAKPGDEHDVSFGIEIIITRSHALRGNAGSGALRRTEDAERPELHSTRSVERGVKKVITQLQS